MTQTDHKHAIDLELPVQTGRNNPYPCMTTTDILVTMIMALRRNLQMLCHVSAYKAHIS